jgi:hypothetical protein
MARDLDCQQQLISYLKRQDIPLSSYYKTCSYSVPINHSLAQKKDFFPIPCPEGIVRPFILIMLEELVRSGIEEICLYWALRGNLGSIPISSNVRDALSPIPDKEIIKIVERLSDFMNKKIINN